MWGHVNIGKMLPLKLSYLLILLFIVDTISSLSLTAIEVPKYAKVHKLSKDTHTHSQIVRTLKKKYSEIEV